MLYLLLTVSNWPNGHHPLLDGASLVVDAGERIGLIGRKAPASQLLKIIAGSIRGCGRRLAQPALKLAYVRRSRNFKWVTRVRAVAEGVGEAQRLLADYHAAAHRVAEGDMDAYRFLSGCRTTGSPRCLAAQQPGGGPCSGWDWMPTAPSKPVRRA